MARDLLPWMIILGAVLFGVVVASGLRMAKWRQREPPKSRWYRRLRRPPHDQSS